MNIREMAVKYIKSLSPQERETLANMINNGITCCHTYAEKQGITPEMLTNELKLIFKGE